LHYHCDLLHCHHSRHHLLSCPGASRTRPVALSLAEDFGLDREMEFGLAA